MLLLGLIKASISRVSHEGACGGDILVIMTQTLLAASVVEIVELSCMDRSAS